MLRHAAAFLFAPDGHPERGEERRRAAVWQKNFFGKQIDGAKAGITLHGWSDLPRRRERRIDSVHNGACPPLSRPAGAAEIPGML